MLLSKTKAEAGRQNVVAIAFAVDPNVVQLASTKYTAMMANTNDNQIAEMMKYKTVAQLDALQEDLGKQLQESAIGGISKHFIHEIVALDGTVNHVKKAMTALEFAFEHIFLLCYFDEDTLQYDFAQFNDDVDKAVIRAEARAEMGGMDDDI